MNISSWSNNTLQWILNRMQNKKNNSLGSGVQWAVQYLWRQHRSRGRRAPPELSWCLSSWPASRQWRPETGRWTDPEHSWWRPMLEPGGGEGRGRFLFRDPCSQEGPQPCHHLLKQHTFRRSKVELKAIGWIINYSMERKIMRLFWWLIDRWSHFLKLKNIFKKSLVPASQLWIFCCFSPCYVIVNWIFVVFFYCYCDVTLESRKVGWTYFTMFSHFIDQMINWDSPWQISQ